MSNWEDIEFLGYLVRHNVDRLSDWGWASPKSPRFLEPRLTMINEMQYIPDSFFSTEPEASPVHIVHRTAWPAWRGPGGRRHKGSWDPVSAEKKTWVVEQPNAF
jgi:hypothetical protein